jgi:uncharacterized membrane protein YedE/YeeE
MKQLLAAFIAGFVFAVGLAISGMTQPEKVIGFLDITGDWDPSLMFVMVGAIAVHAAAYHLWLKKWKRPLLVENFSLPTSKVIDGRLLLGSALFGVGWGLGGFCPGPALVSTMSYDRSVLTFVLSMLAGMVGFHFFERARQKLSRWNHSVAQGRQI